MQWWMWLIGGIALLALETVTPGTFVAFFFGVGAILIAGIAGLGLEADWLQWVLFPLVSLMLLAVFRRRIQSRLGRRDARKVDTLEGESVVALEDIAPQQIGKVELRGSPWNAKNLSDYKLARGAKARVETVSGVTLGVRLI
jgi:inner membrane protein